MSMTPEQQEHSDYLDRVAAAAAELGFAVAGPDHPVYRDKNITVRSVNRSPSRSKNTSPGESSPPK